MKKNKKGFTLIELLAVIVVLAILILVAMPKVTSMMAKARQNTFAVDATEIVKVAKTAYSDKVLEGADNVQCFSVSKLISEGYLDKKTGDVTGYVKIETNIVGGVATTTITTQLSKTGFYINDSEAKLNGNFSSGDVKNSKNNIFTDSADCAVQTVPAS